MKPHEQLERLLRAKEAFPSSEATSLLDKLAAALPFTDDEHRRMARGLTSEARFSDVFSALEWGVLIHGLHQQQLPPKSQEEWQVPDHLAFVRTPGRPATPVLLETKHVSGEKVTFEIHQMNLLESYAGILNAPVLLALFWEKLKLWTLNTPDQLARSRRTARLSLETAVRNDVSVVFSDTLLVINKDWRRKTTYDPTAEGFHLKHQDRGFVVDDYLAVNGKDFVQLSEVESGIINRIMRPKVLDVAKDGARTTVTTASTAEAVAKASSIVHLLLEEFEAFGQEDEPDRAFNTLARLKLNVGIPIRAHLPESGTAQVHELFLRTFGFSWPKQDG